MEEALGFLEAYEPQQTGAEILFSPVPGLFPAERVARVLVDRFLGFVRLNLQIHKVIWGPDARGV